MHNTTGPLTYVTSSVNSIFIPYVSANDITEGVQSLKNSSVSKDSILASIGKSLTHYYVKPLTRLINFSFENGLFPNELKIAKVIPIFFLMVTKSGSKGMEWQYDDDHCVWGGRTEIHVLLECKCYDLVRRRWMRTWDVLDEKERIRDIVKGYVEVIDDVENETMRYLGEVWIERQRNEKNRVNVIP